MPKGSKYYDASAAIQVIGGVLNNPSLLDSGQYDFRDIDFCNEFHKVIFGAIYNVKFNGAEKLNTKIIEDWLQGKEKSYAIYKANNGSEWMHNAFVKAEISNFDYYYNRLKKMTLLRTYDEIGLDVSWIYDPDNILDLQKKEEQEKEFDQKSLEEIADEIDQRIDRVREMVVDGDSDESCQAGEGLNELLEDLSIAPISGNPLWDKYFDQIVLGARMGCFYLRSGSTGTGKSRTAMADACYLACDEYFDVAKADWVSIGRKNPTVFISVELDISELQTMALAFISGVPENHIIRSELDFEEKARLKKAVEILERSDLYFEYYPDYSIKDIENCIRRHHTGEHKVSYVFLDYITSSMKIIEEVARASAGTYFSC